MLRRGIFIIVLFAVMQGVILFSQVFAEQPELKRVAGEVWDIDWVAGKLMVRTMDFTTVDEMVFLVSQDTKIIKGTAAIGFAEVKTTDQVQVEYYSSLAGLKAVRIMVQK